MKLFISFIIILGSAEMVQAQDSTPKKDTYSYYGRIADHGGNITLFRKTDGKIYIKAEDNYGARMIGLKDGYTADDLKGLINYLSQDKGICIRPLLFGAEAVVATAAALLSPLVWLAQIPVNFSAGKICDESVALNKTAKSEISSAVEDLKDPTTIADDHELRPRDYWHLYDLIEGHAQLQEEAQGLGALAGGHSRSATH